MSCCSCYSWAVVRTLHRYFQLQKEPPDSEYGLVIHSSPNPSRAFTHSHSIQAFTHSHSYLQHTGAFIHTGKCDRLIMHMSLQYWTGQPCISTCTTRVCACFISILVSKIFLKIFLTKICLMQEFHDLQYIKSIQGVGKPANEQYSVPGGYNCKD